MAASIPVNRQIIALCHSSSRLTEEILLIAVAGKTALIDHSVKGALKGLFHYIAKEEAAIRQNPAKRTTDLLKRVFGD